ncbi:hypothetical protein D3C87_1677190 [compost metagenome]
MAPAELDADSHAAIFVEQDGRCRLAPATAQDRTAIDQALALQVDQNGRNRLRRQAGNARNLGIGDARIERHNGQHGLLIGAPDAIMAQPAATRVEYVLRRFTGFVHGQAPWPAAPVAGAGG